MRHIVAVALFLSTCLCGPLSTPINADASSFISTAAPLPLNVVGDGNSITKGDGTSNEPTTSWFNQSIALVQASRALIFFNDGVSGETTPQMTTRALTVTDPRFAAGYKNVVVGWEITNDIVAGSSAATAYANIVAYCQARLNAGWLVAVATAISRSNTGFDATKDVVNANIRANWPTFATALIDFAAGTPLGPDGAYANTTYFNADGVHPTDVGAAVLATYAAPIIAGM